MSLMLRFTPFSLEATKSAILPELVELTNDEESYVRITGLETVVSILSLLDDGTYVQQQGDTTLDMGRCKAGKVTFN